MMRRSLVVGFALSCAAGLAACSSGGADDDPSQSEAAYTEADDALLVLDPPVLTALESRGYSMSAIFGAPGSSAAELATLGTYRSIVETVEQDLAEARAADGTAGVGFSYDHRLFDATWLRSPQVHFELVAVSTKGVLFG